MAIGEFDELIAIAEPARRIGAWRQLPPESIDAV
jgi:hypothetical protein